MSTGYWSAGKYMPKQYRKAVAWIALNDEAAETDLEEISRLISVCLIADLYRLKTLGVAYDVTAFRKNHAQKS